MNNSDDHLKCRYCHKGIGAGGRAVPFHNEASLHGHETRCPHNPGRAILKRAATMSRKQVIDWFQTEIEENKRLGNTGRVEVYENAVNYLKYGNLREP